MITVGLYNDECFFQRTQQLRQRVGEDVLHLHRPRRAAGLDTALDLVQQMLCRLDTGVRHQKRGLELFVELVVDLPAGEHLRDAGAGLAQARAELLEPALALRSHRRGHRNFHWLHQRAADEAALLFGGCRR
jgi:hypothetical protein